MGWLPLRFGLVAEDKPAKFIYTQQLQIYFEGGFLNELRASVS